MQHHRLFLAACAALAVMAPCGPSLAQPAAPSRGIASLTQAEDKLFHDQVAGDAAALARDVGDDLIYTHATGMQQTKAQFLAFAQAGKVHFKFIHPTNRVFRLYGQPGALIGLSHETFTIDIGLPHVLTGITTGVYAERDGGWQLVAWQTTDVKQPAAP